MPTDLKRKEREIEVEEPPELDEEDNALLDRIWDNLLESSDHLSQWWAEDVVRINDMAEAARQGKFTIEVGAARQEFSEDGSLKTEKPVSERSPKHKKLPPSSLRRKKKT